MEVLPLQQLETTLPSVGVKRLRAALVRSERGFNKDLRTPLYDSQDREDIIDVLESELGPCSVDEIAELDEKEKEKIGPFSIMLPFAERREGVEAYWSQSFNPDEALFSNAVSIVKSLIPPHSLRVASLSTAFDLMPKDTSLGLPWLTRDKDLANEYLRRASQLNSATELYPAVLYWRGQPKGLDAIPKQRVVWGFDHAETIYGAQVLYPVLNVLRQLRGFSAWLGDVYVDEEMTSILNDTRGAQVLSMDYSAFDSSLSCNMIIAAGEILKSWFSPDAEPIINLLVQSLCTTALVTPAGVFTGRNGGMPSGSVLTNLVDTLCNLIAGHYSALRNGTSIRRFAVLGDDSVYVYGGDVDASSVSSAVSELGLESNPDKQMWSDHSLHYLQRIHTITYKRSGLCVGVRSPYRALSGLTGYERMRTGWNKYMDSARWIMQVENCKHYPNFRSLVRFLKEGDDVLRSGISPKEIFARAGGADVVRSVLNIASFPFNVQNPERVRFFETTRVLMDMH